MVRHETAGKEMHKNTSAIGGGSQSQLSTADEPIAGIIGETSLSGIIPDGDSDNL